MLFIYSEKNATITKVNSFTSKKNPVTVATPSYSLSPPPDLHNHQPSLCLYLLLYSEPSCIWNHVLGHLLCLAFSHSEHSVSRLIHLITCWQVLHSLVYLNISSYRYTVFCLYIHSLLNISDVLFLLIPHRTLRGLPILIFEKLKCLNAYCLSVEPALSNSMLHHLKFVYRRLTNNFQDFFGRE